MTVHDKQHPNTALVQSGGRFDSTIQWLLITLLAFMPLAFGAVEAWSEMVVMLLAGSIGFCLIARFLFRRDLHPRFNLALVPVALFLGLVVLQLMPMPASLLAWISPHTLEAKTNLLSDLPDSAAILHRVALSFYPWATRHDLRLLLAVATVFVAVLQVIREPAQIKRMLTAVAVIGGIEALIALAQDFTLADHIYWIVYTPIQRASAGTFVHYSHFSQFMELSIGAAIALLMVRLHEVFGSRGTTLPAIVAARAEPPMRLIWMLAVTIVLCTLTLLLSFSRGGVIALLSASVFTTIVMTAKRGAGGRAWFLTIILLVAFVAVLYTGFDAVYQRLATMSHFEQAQEGRLGILHDLLAVYRRYPLFGTGMGSHQVVYPGYDHSDITALATHAENEYAQLLEESGIIGAALFLCFVGLVWWAYARCIRDRTPAICSAAFGLGFGLFAVTIHSLSDFGQHLPANAILSAVCCGLLLNLAVLAQRRRPVPAAAAVRAPAVPGARALPASLLWHRIRWGGIAMACLAAWGWCLAAADNSREAEYQWAKACSINNVIESHPADLATAAQDHDLLLAAESAARSDPDNAKYHYWLNVYRWEAISRARDPQNGKVLLTAGGLTFARQVATELNAGRALCPTFGPPYCVAGQLERFVTNQPGGERHIQIGYSLAPTDAISCYVAGSLDASRSDWSGANSKFRHALALNSGLYRRIAECCIVDHDQPALAMELAKDDIGRLSTAAELLQMSGKNSALIAQARADAAKLLRAQCAGPDASAGELASLAAMCAEDRDFPSAVLYYRRAVALDYGQVDWRFQLAELLKSTGQPRPAMHEARVCLRLRPQWPPAQQLVADLSVMPGVASD